MSQKDIIWRSAVHTTVITFTLFYMSYYPRDDVLLPVKAHTYPVVTFRAATENYEKKNTIYFEKSWEQSSLLISKSTE